MKTVFLSSLLGMAMLASGGALANTPTVPAPAVKPVVATKPAPVQKEQGVGFKVNINTADAATLSKALSGVGPAKAQAIVDYRKKNGAFTSIAQLEMVKGIGPATIEKNRQNIVLK